MQLTSTTRPETMEDYQFDSKGYMKYHPDFHPFNGIPFTEADKEYLCKFLGIDELRTIAFALGKTEASCNSQLCKIRRLGLFDHYKNLNLHW